MPRKPKTSNIHDELNLARFGIISMNTRLNQAITTWKSEFAINGRTFRVEVVTPEGRPHGIDTDTLVAIETLFVTNGCPEDNWVHTTAYELRELMGLQNNGANYHRLRQSLRRLYLTSAFLGSKTSIEGTNRVVWDNVGVRFLEGFRYRDTEDESFSLLDATATLSIRLGEQLAASLRSGVSQVLDGHLLHQLVQPPARALYRTLQAHRRQADGTLLQKLTVPLSEWQQAAGLTSDRTDLVRRALEAAHEELIANKYLESAQIEGRGQQAQVHYSFAERDSADPALVLLLRQAGVSVARASALAAQYPEQVEDALRFLALRKSAGSVRNPGGLVADFLANPDKYQLPDEFLKPVEEAAKHRADLQEARERALAVEQESFAEELVALEKVSPDEQWLAQKGMLQILLKKELTTTQWARLEELAVSGEVQAVALSRALATAKLNPELFREQLEQLKAQLEL